MTDKQTTGQPFDDIRDLIRSMPSVADLSESDVQESAQSLGRGLRPIGSLETPLARISAWQDAAVPRLMRPLIAVFAGTHGVAGKLGFEACPNASVPLRLLLAWKSLLRVQMLLSWAQRV